MKFCWLDSIPLGIENIELNVNIENIWVARI